MLFTFLALACTPATLVNVEPDVNITNPTGDDEIRAGEPVYFTADVEDDGGATGLDLAWEIVPEPGDVGNALLADGEATYYLDGGLAEGEYQVTLTVADYAGLTDSDTITLQILENERPKVRIEYPEEGATYDDADPLIVQVEVNAKDDAMSNIQLTWGGVAEGVEDAPSQAPSEGTVIFRIENLERGDHELEVTASDGGGESDTESVNFTIR